MAEQSLGDYKSVDYGGQQVLTDPRYLQTLNDAVQSYNQSSGKNLTAKEYDYQINPTTAGARWGEAAPTTPTAPTGGTGTGAPYSGGLLSPGVPSATPATAATYNPVKQTVSDQSTVQNQLANITSSGSKLNTLAEAEANKQSNRRGLLNSSLAVGAAQKSVLQSALPIAQQDAGVYANTDSANAQYGNAAAQFNANAQNQVSLANSSQTLQQALAKLQSNTQISLADKDNQTKVLLAQLNANTQKDIANLDSTSKLKLSQLEADNRQLLQTNISAANAYAQYAQALSGIQSSDKLDATAKQQAADSQLAALQAALKAIGQVSGLDLSKYFQSANGPTLPLPNVPNNPGEQQQ